jgi:hypothetical protein
MWLLKTAVIAEHFGGAILKQRLRRSSTWCKINVRRFAGPARDII